MIRLSGVREISDMSKLEQAVWVNEGSQLTLKCHILSVASICHALHVCETQAAVLGNAKLNTRHNITILAWVFCLH